MDLEKPQYLYQRIPESEKDEEWLKANIKRLTNLALTYDHKNDRDVECFKRYYGFFDDRDFSYLTKEFGADNIYPVQMKSFHLIKPILDVLCGEEIESPKNYHVRAIDEDTLDYKQRKINVDIFNKLIDKMISDVEEYKRTGLKPKDSVFNEKLLKEYTEKSKRDFLTEQEIIASKLAKYYEYVHKLKTFNNKLFLNNLITGKQFWKVDIPRIGSDPEIRFVNSANFWFSGEEDVDNISDCNWCVERVFMTPEQVIDLFGDELLEDDKERILEGVELYGNAYSFIYPAGYRGFQGGITEDEQLENLEDYSIYGGTSSENKIEVYYVQWKSIRELNLAELENSKNPDSPFYKLFNNEDMVEYKKGKKKNVRKINKRYIQELYEGVQIGHDIFVRFGKSKYQVRSIREPYYVKLNYNGKLFASHNSPPYSLVWTLRHLEDYYRVLHYHEERIISLSGSKGIIYDKALMPEGYTLKEVMYYMKMGLMLIDSSLGNGQFNQFTTYNNLFDASLSIIRQLMESVVQEAERISGVNRQRMGQMFQKDLVGQIDKSMKQSHYSTAVLYNFQSEVYKCLLEDLINFAKFAYKEDNDFKTLSYVLGDSTQEIFKIDEQFCLSDVGIFFSDSGREARTMEELKAMASSMASQGNLNLPDMIKLLKSESLAEVESGLVFNLEEKQKELEELQKQQAELGNQTANSDLELKQKEIQTRLEIAKMQAETQLKLKEFDLMLQREKLANDKQMSDDKINLDKDLGNKELEIKEELKELEKEQLEASYFEGVNGNSAEIKNIV
jgi:hypothetical protein